MARYDFHLRDGGSEDHAIDLRDDAAAVGEGLRTVSGLINELQLSGVGETMHSLEVRDGAVSILRIEVRATRTR